MACERCGLCRVLPRHTFHPVGFCGRCNVMLGNKDRPERSFVQDRFLTRPAYSASGFRELSRNHLRIPGYSR